MTPQEQAERLLWEYDFVDHCNECGGGDNRKKCALITVKFYLQNNISNACIYHGMTFNQYWKKVAQSIKIANVSNSVRDDSHNS